MDQNESARRQYDPYATQSSSQTAHYSNPGSVERFLQHSFLQQSPTSGPSPARAESSGAGTRAGGDSQQQQQDQLYGFSGYGGVSSLQQYPSDVGAGSSSRASQVQLPPPQPVQQSSQTSLYPSSYGSGVMYGMAQTQTQQSPYDHVSQFRSRPGAPASDSLTNQFAVSQSQYYLPSHTMPTANASSADFPAPHLSSQYHAPSSYPQAGPSTPTTYSTSAMLGGSSQAGAYSSYTTPQTADYNPTQSSQTIDQAFNEYQSRVRSIFTSVRDGTLRDIVVQLLNISHYLLGNAEALGLTRDDDALHDDRIRLWDEFNRAWLATLQRQFDLTQEMMQSNQPVREPQSIMTQQSLEHLSREVVRMCDSVEKHGLVDYQMGVAEEEIMDLLLRCLQLLDPPNDRNSDAGTGGTGEVSGDRHLG